MRQARHPPLLAARGAGAICAALLLSACAARTASSQHDAAALAACRERADEVFQKQNRADVYRSDVYATSGRDAPFATSGLPGITTRGLSGEYQRDNMVDDCLNASTSDRGQAAPAQAPAQSSAQSPGQAGGTVSPSFSPPSTLP